MGVDLPRNFTIPTAERLRALASGPPPFARRLRRIEDLEAAVVGALAELEGAGERLDPAALPDDVLARIARLHELVADHNRYYPIEANLPIDLRTGRLMDWGEPWAPTVPPSAAELLARARGR